MDRAEIDRQLNLRERWPEHTEYIARWAADSANVRRRLGGYLDLVYGDSAGERLDLFLPRPRPRPRPRLGPARPPLLAFIHGGYWQFLDKGDFSYLAPPFLDAGIAIASLNYDLIPRVAITEIVGQIRRAILWLARQADTYGFDADRIYVAGHSAGGHLAVMALITDWAVGKPGIEPIKGACSISGIYELEPVRQSYQQEILGLDAATVRDMSPLRLVPARAGPLILAVGSEETEEFLLQQKELAAAWRARGLSVRIVDLPGRHHFSVMDDLGDAGHLIFAAVRDMVLGA
ncbi:MAG: alpha/beta hydrolase [Alphaproteobacteria bacterium]